MNWMKEANEIHPYRLEQFVDPYKFVNVTKALSQKITIPVLNGIVLDVKKEGIELLASDSELTIKVIIDKKEIKNGN